jgi:dihydroxy-acid dehydratase
VVGHITPEACVGGPLAIVHEGDTITIDAEQHRLTLHLDQADIDQRLSTRQKPAPRYTRGVLAKYARLVSSASEGAVTDQDTGMV